MQNDKIKKYFIAIIPPEPVFSQALELKHYFSKKYNSKAALNSPPHITLHMPFEWKAEKEIILIEKLQEFAKDFRSFNVSIDNFSSFPPHVIFINVIANPELNLFQKELQRFCKTQLNLLNTNYRELPFHAHLTLAFRDLKKNVYPLAWEEFQSKELKAEFEVKNLALLKHNGKTWDVRESLELAE